MANLAESSKKGPKKGRSAINEDGDETFRLLLHFILIVKEQEIRQV
jgi:hypothetical protein